MLLLRMNKNCLGPHLNQLAQVILVRDYNTQDDLKKDGIHFQIFTFAPTFVT